MIFRCAHESPDRRPVGLTRRLCSAPSPFVWSRVRNSNSRSPQQAHRPPYAATISARQRSRNRASRSLTRSACCWRHARLYSRCQAFPLPLRQRRDFSATLALFRLAHLRLMSFRFWRISSGVYLTLLYGTDVIVLDDLINTDPRE